MSGIILPPSPKACVNSHKEDDFLGALLVMNDTSKPLKEDSSDRALLPPSCLRAASEGDDHRDKVDLLL